ncbi:MAG: MazG-like protein [Pseudopedobacter saltans]|uniref:MazG-like protein n=1 Tax=Pseudopedobacter saltans TaxID=151895 RepID=A0A2W5EC79_9SPHI|nr:MAG: MazG-like protein [Pseudopedobacter saltans]
MSDLDEIIQRSLAIRTQYHKLEKEHHGSEWSIEEDALAFLTDAGLVGRNIMSKEGRWPKSNTEEELSHKIGESIWWLIILAERNHINTKDVLNNFLSTTEETLHLSKE